MAQLNSLLVTGNSRFLNTMVAQGGVYTDSYTGALDMNNSNIYGVNSIYTADASDHAGEGIHFYRDATHVDTLWMNGGDLLFVPNRALGTSTTKANSQKVARFTANPTTGQVVVTDGTTGGVKTTGFTIDTSVPQNAVFTDTKVTAVGNHYTPSGGSAKTPTGDTDTNITNLASGSGSQVISGVTIDAAGHVTGLTSKKIRSVNTTYANGTGITIGTGNAINHSNSVTAQTTQKVYPIKIDAQGHISAYGTSPTTLSGYGITDAKIASGVITLGSNTITPLTSHQTVTDNNPTLAWGTKSKVATIGSTEINVTMPSNPNTNTIPSAYCDTAAATAAKVASCSGYALLSKSWVHVLIVNSNTSKTALTLNINSKGAKSIYINGTASSTSNYTLNAGTYFVYYDGTNYYFRNDGKIPAEVTSMCGYFNTVTNSSANRQTSANITASNNGGIRTFIATSSMTTGKPAVDGNIIHFDWDSGTRYASQLAILHGDGRLQHRYQTGTGTMADDWTQWYSVYSEAYKPTASDVGLGNVGNFKAVSTVASQGLTDTEKSNARTNIGAGTSSLALGETSSTAYRGDRGKTAYTHATDSSRLTTATSSGLYKVASTAQGHIASLTAIEKADITGLGIPASDTQNTAGSTNTTSKIYLVGTTDQTTGTNSARTYSDINVYTTNGTLTSSKTDTKAIIARTGSGTAGSTSETTPKYTPTKWTFNSGITVANGEVYFIKIPVAGGTYGVWCSLNNGANYYPVAISSGKGRFTTHYGANTVIAITYESAGVCTCYPLAGGDATSDVTGIFRVLNDYDANTTYSAMSSSELTTGTATTSRVVRSDYLKSGINSLIDTKINALDVTTSGAGASKTLTALSEANGKISATFGNISITTSQISDYPTSTYSSFPLTQTVPSQAWTSGQGFYAKWGNVVQIMVRVQGTNKLLAAGTDGFSGTFTAEGLNMLPLRQVTLIGYTGSTVLMGWLETDGSLSLRASQQTQIGNGNMLYFTGMYIIS